MFAQFLFVVDLLILILVKEVVLARRCLSVLSVLYYLSGLWILNDVRPLRGNGRSAV